RDEAHQARDLALEKLRNRFAPKLARLKDQLASAEARLEREEEQYSASKVDTAVSIGSTILGALFGRKVTSSTNVRKAGRAARGITRAARERADVKRAEEKIAVLQEKLTALSKDFEDDSNKLRETFDPDVIEIEEIEVAPRKSDIAVEPLTLLWMPWSISDAGRSEPAFKSHN
ncbi:MAG: hypothetical protein R3245_11470, partial [Kiloniellales bacterium]|nr:hypothetical protein [Kiloniellales bacterium]